MASENRLHVCGELRKARMVVEHVPAATNWVWSDETVYLYASVLKKISGGA